MGGMISLAHTQVVFDAQNTKKFAMPIFGAPKIPFGFFSVPRVMASF